MVVVPWHWAECPHRARALRWVRRRYAEGDWPICVAASRPGPWVKAWAVMPVIESADDGVIVVADADVWTDGLAEAVRQVEDGAAWAVPHTNVVRLSEAATSSVIDGASPSITLGVDQPPYEGLLGGGIVVARRETLLQVPLDPRFVGWGQEDWSWGVALWHLLGPCWRGDADLWHLYHPPQPRMDRKRGSEDNMRLMRRYRNARGDWAQMQALVKEARDALESVEDSVRDPSPGGVCVD